MPTPSVECLALSKTYPGADRPVIDGLNLQVQEGELLVMVGPSGCGKSTVLRMIAGLETISSGELRIGGRRVNELEPKARDVAMVFQDYALYPHMSVRDNLAFPLKMRRVPANEQIQKIARVADMLHLGELLQRKPAQLSGGQRQRVAMGRALIREASVFLLDEPLSNLDAKLRGQVRAEIAALQQQLGATMLYVTHDQTEAMTLGQRVAVFNQGRLQQIASPRELYEAPTNTFVAGFIGQPPMNLLAARMHDGQIFVGAHGLAIPAALLPANLPTSSLMQHGTLTLGIRPEDLRLARPGEAGLSARVSMTEFLGHETLLHAQLTDMDASIILRLQGVHALSIGTPLQLTLSARPYFFDQQGMNLETPSPA
ncbi:MAG: ABC transporter ATP-binding protein [Halothiobacillaceae bacterium]